MQSRRLLGDVLCGIRRAGCRVKTYGLANLNGVALLGAAFGPPIVLLGSDDGGEPKRILKPHQKFERLEDGNILYSLKLKYTELVLGTEIIIPTLYGSEKLKIPAGTQIDSIFRFRGKGMPIHGRHSKGDQIVNVKLDIPTKLSERQKWLIKELDDTKNV